MKQPTMCPDCAEVAVISRLGRDTKTYQQPDKYDPRITHTIKETYLYCSKGCGYTFTVSRETIGKEG